MNIYSLEKTESSPSVLMNPNGQVEIKGISISENSTDFFGPILDWVKQYSENPAAETKINLILEYLDSGSLGFVNLVLDRFNAIHKAGKSRIEVKWSYDPDDLDMEEFGEDLKTMFDFDVILISTDV